MHQLFLRIFASFLVILLGGAFATTAEPDCPAEPSSDDAPWHKCVGTIIEASGAQYAGHFENGQPSGKGQYIDAEGNIYSGRFEGGKPSGHASVEYANGEKYSGYLANGKRHGYGTIKRLDQSTYQGRFRHDVYHGQGSLLKRDGTILEGIWRHGEFQFARKRGGTIRRRESITAPDVRYFVHRPFLIDLTTEGEPTVPSDQDLLFAEVYSDNSTSDEPILVFDQYEYSHLILEAVLDMDEDGYSEVILRAQTGGNCFNCVSYYLLSHRGGGNFELSTHPDFKSAIHVTPQKSNGETFIVAYEETQGTKRYKLLSWESTFRLSDGKLELVSKIEETGDIIATTEISITDVSDGLENRALFFDIDDDGEKDEFDCSFWGKYQHFQCSIHATRSGLTVEEFDYCAVLGILDTSTNGLRDLVCDRREIFTFDGIEYLPIKMPEKKNGL